VGKEYAKREKKNNRKKHLKFEALTLPLIDRIGRAVLALAFNAESSTTRGATRSSPQLGLNTGSLKLVSVGI
jgi:hypothetical protein